MPVGQYVPNKMPMGGGGTVISAMPLMVRNNADGPTVFHDPQTGADFEWAAINDPNGEDYQQVPQHVLTNPAFIKNLNRGIFEVTDADDETQAILERQVAGWARRRAAQEQAAASTIENTPQNDMISMPCVAPGPRPGTSCGVLVPMRERQVEEVPALCDSHRQFKNQFVLSEGEFDNSTGKAKRRWVIPTAGAALPSQANV